MMTRASLFVLCAAVCSVGCTRPPDPNAPPYVSEAIVEAAPDVVREQAAAVWPDIPLGPTPPGQTRPWAAVVSSHPRGSLVRLMRRAGAPGESVPERMRALSTAVRYAPVSVGFNLIPASGDPACLYEPGEEGPPPAPAPPTPEAQFVPDEDASEVPPMMLPDNEAGMRALSKRVTYPHKAKRAGIEGRVHVQFLLDERGVPTCITVPYGVHPLLDEAAVRAVEPTRFRPGMVDGEPVSVQFFLPITFRLR